MTLNVHNSFQPHLFTSLAASLWMRDVGDDVAIYKCQITE
jgi:hypothetical protein